MIATVQATLIPAQRIYMKLETINLTNIVTGMSPVKEYFKDRSPLLLLIHMVQVLKYKYPNSTRIITPQINLSPNKARMDNL